MELSGKKWRRFASADHSCSAPSLVAKAQCFTFSEKLYPDDTYSALSSDFPAAKAFRLQLDR